MLYRTIVLIAFGLSLVFAVSSYAIQVSGDIWGVWNPANNPYEVTGDLRVPRDSSLTILPGCSIQFQGHYKIQIDSLAKLIAIGTAQDSIHFFPIDTVNGWGGVRLYYTDTTSRIAYCSFKYRIVASGDLVDGALYNKGGSLNVSNCSFYRNQAGYVGGASIRTDYTLNTKIDSCRFLNNNTYAPGAMEGWGGVVHVDGDYGLNQMLVVSNSVFIHNAGGAVLSWCDSKVLNNIFIDNLGAAVGQYWGDTFDVEYNVFSNNEAIILPSGVMAQEVYGPIYIINNTFCNNRCSVGEDYGIIVIWDEHSFNPAYSIKNNIFWGDTLYPIINGQYYYFNYFHISYSDIRGGYDGLGNIDFDPLFIDTASGDYRIRWDSPCVDAGDPSSPPDPNGSRADMGALQPFIPIFEYYIPGDINGDSNCLGSDVTYGVRYFKGWGNPPPDSVYDDSTSSWLYAAGDVNGNCEFRGSDITYLVGYFKGLNPWRRWCPQTPPF
jgi:hypothetical protein